jgi:hypothetical protein
MNINIRSIKGVKTVRKEGLIFIVVGNTRGKMSQRRLEQVPELIVLTNSRSFENLKLKRKEKKRRREHVIYNKYNVYAC